MIKFYPEEIQQIKKIQKQAKKERKRTLSNAPSLLYFTFLCLGKYFDSATFSVGRDYIRKYSGLTPKTITAWTDWLVNQKYIVVTYKGSHYNKMNSEYYVPLLDSTNSTITDNSTNSTITDITAIDSKQLYDNIVR